jgi:hypothetical protein
MGGIERHFHNAFNIAVCRDCTGDVHAEPPGDRRPYLVGIQVFTFDFTGLQDIKGEGLKFRLSLEKEAEALHAAQQTALPVADVGKRLSDSSLSPVKSRPVRQLV